ncbi:hypothetical protein CAPTEDRAFT_200184 [Capitella teleta]|uniref:Uncharacterized protein n=1 Tax=Capitella teleta TaxID=283909 RepID=R7VJM3_CAPTE|nr:hypothetical protein CAPTEDRAFT_200184 [Capitella teleta]|eukprot:ELU16030.1 hypothetical protein CAPTEDRAFT_200184 [Capitella teleta]
MATHFDASLMSPLGKKNKKCDIWFHSTPRNILSSYLGSFAKVFLSKGDSPSTDYYVTCFSSVSFSAQDFFISELWLTKKVKLWWEPLLGHHVVVKMSTPKMARDDIRKHELVQT